MTKQERKLIICMEECGELIQACSKLLRFGPDENKYKTLVEEMGDVACMLYMLQEEFYICDAEIAERVDVKRKKNQTI